MKEVMYTTYIVRRTQIYLDDEQERRLARRARAEGVTKSRLIRRAIDAFLDAPEDGPSRLARFRVAVEAVSGSVPRLPPGRDYVEQLRAGDAARQQALDRRR
jgi:predicted DNA-binding protein